MKALSTRSPQTQRTPVEPRIPATRWDPFRAVEDEMAMVWDRLGRPFGHWPFAFRDEGSVATLWSPNVDITEDAQGYEIKAELPAVSKEEVKVVVHDGMLSISGERKSEHEEKGRKYHRLERAHGSFERSFTLPADADPGRITSGFKDGVLNVHLPKVPGAPRKTIEVKVT